MAVEHGQRGGTGRNQVGRVLRQLVTVGGGLAGIVQVRLTLNHHVLVIDRVKVRRVNDDRTVHALSHVQAQRGGTTVVQPHAGGLRLKTVDETLTGGDGLHRVIGGDHARVEVQRVAHRAVVDECNFKNVADFTVQNRGHVLPVEGPHVDGHAGGNLAVDLLHLQGDLADGLTVHLLGSVQRRDVRVAVLIAATGCRRHVNLAVSDRHEGRDVTRRGVVVVGVVTGSHLLRGCTGHLHLEDHAQGAVARHGAVRLGIGGHDAGVHGLRLAGVDGAGGCAVIEGQVVGHALILVGDLDDQAVTGGYLHLGGGEAVVAGCLHLDGGGLAGRRDRLRTGVQGGQGREVQRGGVHGKAQQEGYGHGQGSLEALLGVRDGLGGERLRGEGGLLAAGAGRHHLLAGVYLKQEANHENGGHGAHIQLREGGGRHHDDGRHNAHQEPAEAHTYAHGRVLVRALGAQGTNHHPGHE